MIEITISEASRQGIPATVIAAFIGAVATLIAAALVVYYARRQALLAAEKIALEAFDTRWKNFQTWRTAITDQYQKVCEIVGDERVASLGSSPSFQAAKTEARYLFGRDIELQIQAVDAALQSLEERPSAAVDKPGWEEAVRYYYAILNQLLHDVDAFLMLDRIGVNPNHIRRQNRLKTNRL